MEVHPQVENPYWRSDKRWKVIIQLKPTNAGNYTGHAYFGRGKPYHVSIKKQLNGLWVCTVGQHGQWLWNSADVGKDLKSVDQARKWAYSRILLEIKKNPEIGLDGEPLQGAELEAWRIRVRVIEANESYKSGLFFPEGYPTTEEPARKKGTRNRPK